MSKSTPTPTAQLEKVQTQVDLIGNVDSNCPAYWDASNNFYIFNSLEAWSPPASTASIKLPHRTKGPNIFNLNPATHTGVHTNTDPIPVKGKPKVKSNWIEAVIPYGGALYGWYHRELTGLCASGPRPNLAVPKIGAAVSHDSGLNWTDLGEVITAPGVVNCNSQNRFFAGGNGDFSVILDPPQPGLPTDPTPQFAYFLFSSYGGKVSEQGVAVARMAWADRDNPQGRVSKWHQGSFSSPGLGGTLTPTFRPEASWMSANPDGFWGPSIHWNTSVNQWVILLNRVLDGVAFDQRGIYISFSPDLADALSWSEPVRILKPKNFITCSTNCWYPQVIGDPAIHGTDKVAGQRSRFFLRGVSVYELVVGF